MSGGPSVAGGPPAFFCARQPRHRAPPRRSTGTGDLFLWASVAGSATVSRMEEVLPPQVEHGAGFERTRVPQFTVFLENRVGRLTTLLRTLEENVGRVCALSIEESADSALVRLICADPNMSRSA